MVIVLGNAATGLVGDSTVAAVIATLVAVSIAGPARRRIQALLDRRFNRRAFEASEMVRRYVRDPVAGTRIEEVLAEATGDPGLSVAYWIEDRGAWVAWDGGPRSTGAGRRGGHAARGCRSRESPTTRRWSGQQVVRGSDQRSAGRTRECPAAGGGRACSSWRCASRARASSPRRSPSGGRSNATCTTARSSGCSRSRCSFARHR